MRLTTALFSKVGDLTKKFSNLPESYIKRSMEQVNFTQHSLHINKSLLCLCKSFNFTGTLENPPW